MICASRQRRCLLHRISRLDIYRGDYPPRRLEILAILRCLQYSCVTPSLAPRDIHDRRGCVNIILHNQDARATYVRTFGAIRGRTCSSAHRVTNAMTRINTEALIVVARRRMYTRLTKKPHTANVNGVGCCTPGISGGPRPLFRLARNAVRPGVAA